MRLFVFHHAGGSSSSYLSWHRFLPRDWELCLVDLPGRGVNARLPLARTADELVAAMVASIEPFADTPFACHGHSLGGLVAYATVRALHEAGRVSPFWLGVSAAKPPSFPHAHSEAEIILSLTDEQLIAYLKRFGGAPEGLLTTAPEVLSSFLALFRADVSAMACMPYTELPEPLPVPLAAFAATRDTFAPPSELAPWSNETRAFSQHVFEGDHFFVFSSRTEFLRCLVREATTALHGGPA